MCSEPDDEGDAGSWDMGQMVARPERERQADGLGGLTAGGLTAGERRASDGGATEERQGTAAEILGVGHPEWVRRLQLGEVADGGERGAEAGVQVHAARRRVTVVEPGHHRGRLDAALFEQG